MKTTPDDLPEESFIIPSIPSWISWAMYSEEVKVHLTSHAARNGDHLILIDPIELSAEVEYHLIKTGHPTAIVLTNGNHERNTKALKDRYQIPVAATVEAVPHLSFKPDIILNGVPMLHGLKIIPIPGAGPGEVAFYSESLKVLVIGDAVLNLKSTGFCFLPDSYCENPAVMRASLKKLLALPFESMLFAHGNAIESDAHAAFEALFI